MQQAIVEDTHVIAFKHIVVLFIVAHCVVIFWNFFTRVNLLLFTLQSQPPISYRIFYMTDKALCWTCLYFIIKGIEKVFLTVWKVYHKKPHRGDWKHCLTVNGALLSVCTYTFMTYSSSLSLSAINMLMHDYIYHLSNKCELVGA